MNSNTSFLHTNNIKKYKNPAPKEEDIQWQALSVKKDAQKHARQNSLCKNFVYIWS